MCPSDTMDGESQKSHALLIYGHLHLAELPGELGEFILAG